jgi:hypothetical protein
MFEKPKKGSAKRARAARLRVLRIAERQEKDLVRERDVACRFPLCGCRQLARRARSLSDIWKVEPTVSHYEHKGIGGDPTGARSRRDRMVLLCRWRHQDGCVSRDTGTVRYEPLTPARCDGPLSWQVKRDVVQGLCAVDLSEHQHFWVDDFIEVACEAQRVDDGWLLAPLDDWQRQALVTLAEMEL